MKKYKWIFELWYEELLRLNTRKGIRFISIPYFFAYSTFFVPMLCFLQSLEDVDFTNQANEYRPTHYIKK